MGRLRPGQPDGPHPGTRAGRDGGGAVDRLRRRTARQRGLRRRAPARRLRAERLGRRLQPGLPVRGPPAAAAVRRRRRVGLDRCRLAFVRMAAPRGDRRRAHRGAPLPADPDPVPAPADRRPRRPVRHRRRDVLRSVADRHERRLCRAVHRRRLHGVRRDLDGLVEGQGRLLDRHARDRGPARTGAGEQVGGCLRDRCARPADPRAQRARPRPGDPRDDRPHRGPRLHGDQRPTGRRRRRPRASAT